SMGPLPSSGSPSGPTTRPRKLSPTGTDSTSPVRLTCWPSSISLNSPRMTTPISRTSRLSARPRTPFSNSSSSLAMAEGRPSTRAMPSPHSMTVPISSREAPSGSYSWTKCASASRISSGRIVSSAMVLYVFPCVVFRLHVLPRRIRSHVGQPAGRGRVYELIPDLDGNTAYDRGIYHDVQVHPVPVGGGQRAGEPPLLGRCQLDRRTHHRDQLLPPPRRDAGAHVQGHRQRAAARVRHHLRDQPQGDWGHLAAQERTEQVVLGVGGHRRASQGRAQL